MKISAATVDAMLDKLSNVIRQRTAWATLAQLLLLRGNYDSTDPEILAAFRECFPDSYEALASISEE